MGALIVVEGEVFRQPDQQLSHAGIALEVNILIFHTPPEPLDEDIVQRSASHTDFDLLAFEYIGKDYAGELDALIRVEGLRFPVVLQGFFQTIHTEAGIQAVANPPTQHLAAVPIDDRHQIGELTRQPHIGDIGAPHLIGTRHCNTT